MAQLPSNNPNNTSNLPSTFRVGGSGFTAFHWMGNVIGFAQAVGEQSPQPVAQPVAIQPLDQARPMQILVPAAIGAGSLQLQMFEMYNSAVWDRIMQITDNSSNNQNGIPKNGIYNDLADVFLRLSAIGKGISASKIVYPPNAGVRGGPKVRHYAEQFHNCTITDIRNDETIQIGTMEVVKSMTVMYTHMTRVFDTQN
jgi:hypothetical protein